VKPAGARSTHLSRYVIYRTSVPRASTVSGTIRCRKKFRERPMSSGNDLQADLQLASASHECSSIFCLKSKGCGRVASLGIEGGALSRWKG
jgi:hypothetical protein